MTWLFRKKRLNGLVPYKDYVEISRNGKQKYISGFLLITREIPDIDNRLKYYYLFKSYQNLLEALHKSGVPVIFIYSSKAINGKEESGSYVLTYAENEEDLSRKRDIIKSTFMAVFPTYNLIPLKGKDIISLLYMNNLKTKSEVLEPPPVFISETFPKPTKSTKPYQPEFYVPNPSILSTREIRLGYIRSGGVQYDIEYSIGIDNLKNHLVCLGATGSGKTTTIITILNQIRDIKFLVLDFHNEYSKRLVGDILVIKPGTKDGYAFNPILPLNFDNRDEHIALITDIFADTYNFTHPQSYLFKLCLETTLDNYELVGEEEPNLIALVKMIEKHPLRSYYDMETKMALLRRLSPLTRGQAGLAFHSGKKISIDQLLSRNVVIELGHFRETKTREIYAQLLLKQIYDYRIMKGETKLNHITVIEEARNLVPRRRDIDPPNTAERMISELRKFGESIFIISQFPSQISSEVIKNAGIQIYHRIIGSEDLRIISNLSSITSEQLEYLKRLDIGEAIIKDPVFEDLVLVKVKSFIEEKAV